MLVLSFAAAIVALGVESVDATSATINSVRDAEVEGGTEVLELVVEGADILDEVGGRLLCRIRVIR